MALLGQHPAAGSSSVQQQRASRRPRVLAPAVQHAPRRRLTQCRAAVELPAHLEAHLQAELDELEKAEYCGMQGASAAANSKVHAARQLQLTPSLRAQDTFWCARRPPTCPRTANGTTFTPLAARCAWPRQLGAAAACTPCMTARGTAQRAMGSCCRLSGSRARGSSWRPPRQQQARLRPTRRQQSSLRPPLLHPPAACNAADEPGRL